MEELINNIMQTPENTNPNVLRGQLEFIGNNSNSGILAVTDDNGTLDKTFQEIYNAISNDQLIIVRQKTLIPEMPAYSLSMINYIGPSWEDAPGNYMITTNNNKYYADTMDDYPLISEGGPV